MNCGGMKLVRKRGENFPRSHLFENTSTGKEYTVIAKSSRNGLLIIDDKFNSIWVSNSAMPQYFKVIRPKK